MFTGSAVDQAAGLLKSGNRGAAISRLTEAGKQGDVDALFLLATWYLAGGLIDRDLPKARAFLRRAVEIGHVDAALMEIALVANGSGGTADWKRAVSLLREAAHGDPVAAAHLKLIGGMNLDADGHPISRPTAQHLSLEPKVARFQSFLTPEECAHVAQAAAPMLCPSEVVDSATGKLRQHPIRTSDGAVIGPAREDLVIGAITRRIAAISDTDVDQGEPLTILRYSPGHEYRLHHDALPGVENQRIRTVIVYLNQGFSGGETHFPANGLTITPRGGDAIMFDNCTADGAIDPLSRHAGLPILQGAKWIATRWIRRERLDPWKPEKR